MDFEYLLWGLFLHLNHFLSYYLTLSFARSNRLGEIWKFSIFHSIVENTEKLLILIFPILSFFFIFKLTISDLNFFLFVLLLATLSFLNDRLHFILNCWLIKFLFFQLITWIFYKLIFILVISHLISVGILWWKTHFEFNLFLLWKGLKSKIIVFHILCQVFVRLLWLETLLEFCIYLKNLAWGKFRLLPQSFLFYFRLFFEPSSIDMRLPHGCFEGFSLNGRNICIKNFFCLIFDCQRTHFKCLKSFRKNFFLTHIFLVRVLKLPILWLRVPKYFLIALVKLITQVMIVENIHISSKTIFMASSSVSDRFLVIFELWGTFFRLYFHEKLPLQQD